MSAGKERKGVQRVALKERKKKGRGQNCSEKYKCAQFVTGKRSKNLLDSAGEKGDGKIHKQESKRGGLFQVGHRRSKGLRARFLKPGRSTHHSGKLRTGGGEQGLNSWKNREERVAARTMARKNRKTPGTKPLRALGKKRGKKPKRTYFRWGTTLTQTSGGNWRGKIPWNQEKNLRS